MTTIQEIEDAVAGLSHDELVRFSAWFSEFTSAVWDEQIDADARSGKLNTLGDEALRSLDEGRCTEL